MKKIKKIKEPKEVAALSEIEQEILTTLGDNHKHPRSFTATRTMDQAYGLYTYKRGIYCLKASWDIPFTDLDAKEQKELLELIRAKRYKVDPTLQ